MGDTWAGLPSKGKGEMDGKGHASPGNWGSEEGLLSEGEEGADRQQGPGAVAVEPGLWPLHLLPRLSPRPSCSSALPLTPSCPHWPPLAWEF